MAASLVCGVASMAAGDITEWRRQNSEPHILEVCLADGTIIRGTMLIPRDKSVREFIGQPEPFLDIECNENGQMLLSKVQLRYVRPIELPKADNLERQMKQLEKLDAFAVLKLPKTATQAQVDEAAASLLDVYVPMEEMVPLLPPEVLEYMAAMKKRIEAAKAEITAILNPTPKPVKNQAQAYRRPAA